MNDKGLLTAVGVHAAGLGDRLAGSRRLASCTRVYQYILTIPGTIVVVENICVITDCYMVYQVPGAP